MRSKLGSGFFALLLITSSCSTDETVTTTTEPPPLVSLALTGEGLGDVLLGFPPEVVTADISALFGAPDLDSGWIPAETNLYGSCPGLSMRAVGWGSLVTIFINEGTEPLGERFFTYTYGYDYTENEGGVDPRGLNLATEEGISIGATVDSLREAYDSALSIAGDEELDVWSFTIQNSPFRGLLSGAEGGDTVTLIELSPGCG